MRRTVFYSWQSDLPNPTNRGFIERALRDAARLIAADDSLGVEPVIERDTAGVPGAPDIAATILTKIAAADVFVADVSIVNRSDSDGRQAPNPNVLIELGYALHALGFQRVLLVMNTAFGEPNVLPFDLRARRAVLYQLLAETGDKAAIRRELASMLKSALEAALAVAALESVGSIKETAAQRAIKAIEDAKPNRRVAIRTFLADLLCRLDALVPQSFRDGGIVDQLEKAIAATVPVVADFTMVAQAAAVMNDQEVASELYRGFAPIFERYGLPLGFSGTWDKRDFDFYHVLGHEMVVTLFACLLREGRWEVIAELFADRLYVGNHPSGYKDALVDFTFGDHTAEALMEVGPERGRMLVHADILNARHTTEPLSSLLPMTDFMAADYLLYLRAELSVAAAPGRFFEWRPWSALYLREPPRFLYTAERRTSAERISKALGVGEVEVFRQRFSERARRLGSLFDRGAWRDPVGSFSVRSIASRD